jgi:hypothetical protein
MTRNRSTIRGSRLRQPNERDESANAGRAGTVDPVLKQAERDVATGRVDTEQRQAAVPNFERAVRRKRNPSPRSPRTGGSR